MLRLTLAQMRRSIGRLAAAGLAIAIGTAFVAATLLAGDVMTRTGRDAVTARYGQADVVVGGTLGATDLATVRALPHVAAADVSTGRIELETVPPRGLEAVLARLDPAELIASDALERPPADALPRPRA